MRLPSYRLSDYTYDGIQDQQQRHGVAEGQDAIAIGGTFLATDTGRIKALTMTGSSGTTIELYINGQPQFNGGNPSVDGRTYDNPSYYTYNRGDVVSVAATVGPTVGTVALDVESHNLVKKPDLVREGPRQRFKRKSRDLLLPGSIRQRNFTGNASLTEYASGELDRDRETVERGNRITYTPGQYDTGWVYHPNPGGGNRPQGGGDKPHGFPTKPKPGGIH